MSIAPYLDIPFFPPSEHHDVYFDITVSSSLSPVGGGVGHSGYLFYRGHFPKSQFLAVPQALQLLRGRYSPPIPANTKFIAYSQGACTAHYPKDVMDA